MFLKGRFSLDVAHMIHRVESLQVECQFLQVNRDKHCKKNSLSLNKDTLFTLFRFPISCHIEMLTLDL